ncbi:hypothetical protein J2T55_000076 [Methylohalomonas lacus]|uniref:Uncharacterized protein n=1 Tax=Methylohalomonas lacus TaxID=398773 RepID=A0AAE3HJD1_9GAMM|nr:hypothetical protein [Methylohalomonas lacus]MCS3902084.1 hypothetical protein [Methylohalomonas lacus]
MTNKQRKTTKASEAVSMFDEFWAALPTDRQANRAKAKDIWNTNSLDDERDLIISDVKKRVKAGYIPFPCSYLRQRLWDEGHQENLDKEVDELRNVNDIEDPWSHIEKGPDEYLLEQVKAAKGGDKSALELILTIFREANIGDPECSQIVVDFIQDSIGKFLDRNVESLDRAFNLTRDKTGSTSTQSTVDVLRDSYAATVILKILSGKKSALNDGSEEKTNIEAMFKEVAKEKNVSFSTVKNAYYDFQKKHPSLFHGAERNERKELITRLDTENEEIKPEPKNITRKELCALADAPSCYRLTPCRGISNIWLPPQLAINKSETDKKGKVETKTAFLTIYG